MFFLLLFNTMAAYLNSCKIFAVTGGIKIGGTVMYWITGYIAIERRNWALVGADVAQAVMYGFASICVFMYTKCYDPAPRTFFWFCADSYKDIWPQFKYELGMGSMVYRDWFAIELVSLLSGRLPVIDYTAFAIAYAHKVYIFAIPLSVADVGLSLVGNAAGGNNKKKAKMYLKAGVTYIIIGVVFVELYVAFLARKALKFYVDDLTTIDRVMDCLHVIMIQFPADFGKITLIDGIRGLGLANSGTVLVIIAFHVVGVPLAHTFCFVYNLDVVGLALGPMFTIYVVLVGQIVIYYRPRLGQAGAEHRE